MAGLFIFTMASPSLSIFSAEQAQSCPESCGRGWIVLLRVGMTVIPLGISRDGFAHLTALLFQRGSHGDSCMAMGIWGYGCNSLAPNHHSFPVPAAPPLALLFKDTQGRGKKGFGVLSPRPVL